MARSRTVKPKFFLNEELAELGPLTQVLFIGLWTAADREGRLEDRPKRIKASVLPYTDCDVDALLDDLAAHGFICRYEVGDVAFIQVYNWHKHQHPHANEEASIIPAKGSSGLEVVPSTDFLGTTSSNGESTSQALPPTDETLPPTDDALRLLTSSLNTSLLEDSTPPISPPPEDEFPEFSDYVWKTWPDRHGKKLNKKNAMVALRRIPADDWNAVAEAVENFAASSYAKDGYAPDLFRWLQKEEWRAWQEPERPENGKGKRPTTSLDPKKYTEGKYAGIFNPKAKAKGEGDAAPY